MPRCVNPPLPDRTRSAAKSLRIDLTDAERKLWFYLRSRPASWHEIPAPAFPPYIVDFYCETAKLAMELDGSQHNKAIDRSRSRYRANQGLCIPRFWDNDVLQNTEAVLELILSAARDRILTPTPLPKGEGPEEQSA